jgi:hypothetical protein
MIEKFDNGQVTSYEWDEENNLSKVTLADGSTMELEYDGANMYRYVWNRPVIGIDPEGKNTSWAVLIPSDCANPTAAANCLQTVEQQINTAAGQQTAIGLVSIGITIGCGAIGGFLAGPPGAGVGIAGCGAVGFGATALAGYSAEEVGNMRNECIEKHCCT